MMNFSKSSLFNLNSIEEIEQSMKNFNINSKKNLFHYYDVTTSQTFDNENPFEQCPYVCTRSYVSSTETDLSKHNQENYIVRADNTIEISKQTPIVKRPLLIPTTPIKKTKQWNRNELKPKKLTYQDERFYEINDRDSGVVLESENYLNNTEYSEICNTIKYNIFQQENKKTEKIPNIKGVTQNSNILVEPRITRSITKKLQLYKNNENNIQEIQEIIETPRNTKNNTTTKATCSKKSTNYSKKNQNFCERKERKINNLDRYIINENDHNMPMLSQYNGNGTWQDKLQWLQPRRDIGMWIQCCRKECKKWRYTIDYHDPVDVPIIWYCEMNSEEPKPEEIESDLIENKYNAGSIVWAKRNTYLWWPAMVDDCPIKFRYYELKRNSIIPVKYHVIFFDQKELIHSWVKCKSIKPLIINKNNVFLEKVSNNVKYGNRIKESYNLACSAIPMTILERLKNFSLVALYKSERVLSNNVNNNIVSADNYKNIVTTIETVSHNNIKKSNTEFIPNLIDLDEIIPSSQPKLDATIQSKKRKFQRKNQAS
ncbi:zinc finger CW-type PWWP domain protein 1-like isoform X2 [Vespula pensylvanica]|uniref:zinc finger CW-type PWWP domain protein 1-like isoform X2 n=1 Tax=Vespula pensylvanica TaxID=30213 RepID=UPI001CBA31B0|nr:zinc finger CW-type PWWP domain protein 1-like isoform X2 [Vespula pensylvanica]